MFCPELADHLILRQQDQDQTVVQICREHGISEPTFYAWKSKLGGMSVRELQRLKHLEEENRRLKQLYAELSLEHQVIEEVLRKKWSPPPPGASSLTTPAGGG